MSIAHKILPHYTYDDWKGWEGRWELMDGHPIAMSPTPVPRHQRVAAELIYQLVDSIRKIDCKDCRVYDGMDYKITDDTILVPDVLIVCGEITKSILDFAPTLVVEILSPSTALRDRNTKFLLYQQQGVAYFLLIDAEKRAIETHRLVNGKFELQPTDHAGFELAVDCKIQPDLSAIFD